MGTQSTLPKSRCGAPSTLSTSARRGRFLARFFEGADVHDALTETRAKLATAEKDLDWWVRGGPPGASGSRCTIPASQQVHHASRRRLGEHI